MKTEKINTNNYWKLLLTCRHITNDEYNGNILFHHFNQYDNKEYSVRYIKTVAKKMNLIKEGV